MPSEESKLDLGLDWSDMLKLTRKADYRLIALRHLALNREGASAKEIAASYGIPTPLLAKVLQKLARNGLLTAAYGTNGGYRLARDPRSINALEVVRAIDGPIILTSCFTQHGRCQTVGCSVKEPLRRIHEGILGLLENISVAEIAQDPPSQPVTLSVIETS
jgi:Rrf2 family protein